MTPRQPERREEKDNGADGYDKTPEYVHKHIVTFFALASTKRRILPPMEPSIFTKIIAGEIPCHKVYEDERTIAFLDIHPLMPGHVLVVPKKQVDDFELLPDEDYQALFATVQKVAKRLKQVYETRKAVTVIMGYEVPHAHVHIMPSSTEVDFYTAIEKRNEQPTEPNHGALAEIAERIQINE